MNKKLVFSGVGWHGSFKPFIAQQHYNETFTRMMFENTPIRGVGVAALEGRPIYLRVIDGKSNYSSIPVTYCEEKPREWPSSTVRAEPQ